MDYDRLRELQEKFEENPRRYFAPLANEYRKGGQHKRAIEICRTHLAQMPGHMSGQIVFAQALFESGEWDEARTVFGRALALDPENLIALRSLGDMSLQAGDTAEARKWYTRLLDADPKDSAVIALLAEIDASPESAASTRTENFPVVEPDSGDEQISTVAQEVSEPVASAPPESPAEHPAPESAIPESPERESPEPESPEVDTPLPFIQTAPDDVEEPAGLERHYPVESAEEAPPAAPELEETGEAIAGITSSLQDVDNALAARRQDEADALDSWAPPPGATVDEHAPATEPEHRAPEPAAAADERALTGASAEPFVNETMAQLYLQQGYRQLALKVYRQLSASRPHDQSLKERIAEIEAADAAEHPEEVAVSRREEPSIETLSETESSRVRESIESPAREEPRAEPEAIGARQPSVREFFATLGRRRPPRASGNAATRAGNSMPADTGASLGVSPPAASLDAVFAGATVSPSDARAASRLAGAFSGVTGASRTPPTPPMPTPRVNPRMPQVQESEEDVAKFRAWLDGLTRE